MLYGYAPVPPAVKTQMYGRGKKSCNSTSGSEFIFQIYLSGNGLEPTEPSQMALGEQEWMEVSKARALYNHLSKHVPVCIFLPFFCICAYTFMCDCSTVTYCKMDSNSNNVSVSVCM